MNRKKGLIILLLSTLTMFIVGCSKENKTKEDSWKTIEDKKEIVVGLDDTFVPMGFRDKSGKIVGFDIDLAKAVFKELGIKPIFQPIDWSMKESELNSGSIDVIWNGYTITNEREKNVLFSESYMNNTLDLVVMKDSKINTLDDMKNKVLGTQNGSSGLTSLQEQPEILLNQIADNDPVLFDTFNDAFMDLQAQRIDALLIDNVYASYYIRQQKNATDFQVIKTPFEKEYFAVGMRKSDKKVKENIDKAIETLKKNGTFDTIEQKWFEKT